MTLWPSSNEDQCTMVRTLVCLGYSIEVVAELFSVVAQKTIHPIWKTFRSMDLFGHNTTTVSVEMSLCSISLLGIFSC